MRLYCKKCNYLLVENLDKASKTEVTYKEEYDLISEGKYIPNDNIWNFTNIKVSYIIHSKSISLKGHHIGLRMQGCCGPSGLDGFNQLCPNCNEEIGILVADCFTPHFIGIGKDKVSLTSLW